MKALINNQRFKKSEIITYGLVFGLVGALIWTISFAASAPSSDRLATTPAAPGNLTTIKSTDSSVDLQWAPAFDSAGVAGYYIIRDGITINQVSSTTYEDTTVQPGANYSYVVESYNSSGKVSPPSNMVSATLPLLKAKPDKAPPSVPTNLSLTIIRPNQVNLSWSPVSDNQSVSFYDVFRNNKKIASIDSTSFGDTTVAPGTTYTYWVVARDPSGNLSQPSTKAHVTTPANKAVEQ